MEKTTKKKTASLSIISSLDWGQACGLLHHLADTHPDIRKLILHEAERLIQQIHPDEVARSVSNALNFLSYDEFNMEAHSQHGYRHEVDIAYDLFCSVMEPYEREMEKQRSLGFKQAEIDYLKGVIKGLYLYYEHPESEISDYYPDDPYEFADSYVQTWRNYHKDPEGLQDLIDYLEEHCPDWDF